MWIFFQAILGALKLYLTFACLQFLPLGDAITIMFIEAILIRVSLFFMHNIFSTTDVTCNQGKQLVKSGRLGSNIKYIYE